MKGDLLKVLVEFHNSGVVNAATNETYICLIPKKLVSLKIGDFRPLSLTTSLYKVLAKVLATRLKRVMHGTISVSQGAFVKGRQILDSVLIANEVIEETRVKKRKGLVFKIDFEKAYDRVNWDYLLNVLENKGFGCRWRKWIKGCLESANFSVLVNGRPRGKFSASRGVRQGDPLSPFLFNLAVDPLSRLLDKARESQLVKGLRIGREAVEVTHLQFADDTIFFLDGDQECWSNLLGVVDGFCLASGLSLNKGKCSLLGINVQTGWIHELASSWGCNVGFWPILYLGLPLGGNPRAKSFWDPVLEKAERRLQGWMKAFLNRGGRLTLIQSVLSSLPTYYLSLFKIPVGVAKSLERLFRRFLWEGEGEGKKDHLVKWEEVSKPSDLGGLGIGNLLVRNKALLGKWLWRFPLEREALWHKVISSKFGDEEGRWDTKVVTNGTARSPWKDISQGYEQFQEGYNLCVGNGNRILFWEDRWLDGLPLCIAYPRLFNLSTLRLKYIAEVAVVDGEGVNWNFGFRRPLREVEMGDLASFLVKLEQVRLWSAREDRRVWKLEQNGQFTVGSYVRLLYRKLGAQKEITCARIWNIKVPPKVRFLLWLVYLRRVSTCEVLQRRRPLLAIQPQWCVLCKQDVETVDHLFLSCPITLKLWRRCFKELGISWVIARDVRSFWAERHFIAGKRKKARILWDCLLAAVAWVVWIERNRRIFSGWRQEGDLWETVRTWTSLWASVHAEFRDVPFSLIWLDWKAVVS